MQKFQKAITKSGSSRPVLACNLQIEFTNQCAYKGVQGTNFTMQERLGEDETCCQENEVRKAKNVTDVAKLCSKELH